MLFSILIPVYNVEPYIRQSIESVLNQDEQDFEIVLADDGSTDSSGSICDEYAAKYPEKIRVIHKQNEGLLLTRRRALKAARGDWFVHLDSDDYLLSGALMHLKNCINDYHPDLIIAGYIYGQKNIEDMSVLSKKCFTDKTVFEADNKYDLYLQLLLRGGITAIWQKIAKRETAGVDEDYSAFQQVSLQEDQLQSLLLLDRANKVLISNLPLFYYRFNQSSISKQKSFAQLYSNFRSRSLVNAQTEKYIEKWRIIEEDQYKIHSRQLNTQCNTILQMAFMVSGRSDKKVFGELVHQLREDPLWNEKIKKSNRKSNSRMTNFVIGMIRLKRADLLILASRVILKKQNKQ